MDRRAVVVCLLEMARGVTEGSLDRPALLSKLAELYGTLGGVVSELSASLPPGTQLAIPGEQGAEQAAQRKVSAAAELRRRAERIVRYWIVRTGRDLARTEVSDDRVRTVMKILKTKTDEEAMQAIANVADSDFHAGDNDRERRFDTVDVIFGRGIEKFESHRDSDDAPIHIDVALDERVGKKPAGPSASELRARLTEAKERKERAQKGNDRDAFNRWSSTERQLRRALEQALERDKAGNEGPVSGP